ncbi:hypothetical protein PHISCL_03068 [Aspergillus sclerotialis]|uniref:EKC/KEOPS complex subunit BUD32 n=1 Tax=Aspergillus sclerotialis TaxID=2070753 RepID=A0A3A2ZPH9_9EURO|nr:hypothetical protein PHISCL_03068 [Aspergillus sclerotialis]
MASDPPPTLMTTPQTPEESVLTTHPPNSATKLTAQNNINIAKEYMSIAYSPTKNQGRSSVSQLCNPDSKFWSPSTFPGCSTPMDYAESHVHVMASVADLRIVQYDQAWAKDSHVLLRYTAEGSHCGEPYQGIERMEPPKRARWSAAAIFDIVDGKVASFVKDWDQKTMQHDLDIVGVGASGQVYNVDDQIVLKTCRIFKPPSHDASQRDHWHYASDTLFHFSLLKDERTIMKLLQTRPHPHIIEAIDTDQPKGIYLRKYQQPTANIFSTLSQRIKLYRDIVDALCHLHSLGIVHADIRIDNILFDEHGSAILCDFSAASPCGEPNLVFPDLPLPINGPSPTLSEKSDMFAMASLIYQMEHEAAPELSLKDGTLVLPKLSSGN